MSAEVLRLLARMGSEDLDAAARAARRAGVPLADFLSQAVAKSGQPVPDNGGDEAGTEETVHTDPPKARRVRGRSSVQAAQAVAPIEADFEEEEDADSEPENDIAAAMARVRDGVLGSAAQPRPEPEPDLEPEQEPEPQPDAPGPDHAALDAVAEDEPMGMLPPAVNLSPVTDAIDKLAGRMDRAEKRSTMALSGITQALSALASRLPDQQKQAHAASAQEQKRTVERNEAFRKLAAQVDGLVARIDQVEGQVEGAGVYDSKALSGLEDAVRRLTSHIESRQVETTRTISALEQSVARLTDQFEELQDTDGRSADDMRERIFELSESLDAVSKKADTALTQGDLEGAERKLDEKMGKTLESALDRALHEFTLRLEGVETRSADALLGLESELSQTASRMGALEDDLAALKTATQASSGAMAAAGALDALETRLASMERAGRDDFDDLRKEFRDLSNRLTEVERSLTERAEPISGLFGFENAAPPPPPMPEGFANAEETEALDPALTLDRFESQSTSIDVDLEPLTDSEEAVSPPEPPVLDPVADEAVAADAVDVQETQAPSQTDPQDDTGPASLDDAPEVYEAARAAAQAATRAREKQADPEDPIDDTPERSRFGDRQADWRRRPTGAQGRRERIDPFWEEESEPSFAQRLLKKDTTRIVVLAAAAVTAGAIIVGALLALQPSAPEPASPPTAFPLDQPPPPDPDPSTRGAAVTPQNPVPAAAQDRWSGTSDPSPVAGPEPSQPQPAVQLPSGAPFTAQPAEELGGTPAEDVYGPPEPPSAQTAQPRVPSVSDVLPNAGSSAALEDTAGTQARRLYTQAVEILRQRGNPEQDSQAIRLLKGAADQGLAVAHYRLGTLYQEGRGVSRDVGQALSHYETAARGGNRRAMHNLAVLNATGTGLPQNFDQAAYWFSQAAELGVADSQFNLAVLFLRGQGVAQSDEEAYRWFSIAASQGDNEAVNQRDKLSEALGPAAAAISIAASRWTPKPMDPAANGLFYETDPSQEVLLVQQLLTRLGYSVGAPDGLLGPRTQEAIRAFEREQGLPITGGWSTSLVTQLRDALAERSGIGSF